MMTFEDVSKRKSDVLMKIRRNQEEMKSYLRELSSDYQRPDTFLSVQGVKKAVGWAGGAFYAFKILRSIVRVTGIFRRF